MRDDKYFELLEIANSLSEYYSEQTGKDIEFGVDGQGDIWIKTPRNQSREYYERFTTAEDRVKAIYHDIFIDDDYEDPFGGL
jgi:hypothetical protein